MDRIIRIALTATVMVLVFSGLMVFAALSYHHFFEEFQNQIVRDNQAVGRQLLRYFSEASPSELSEKIMSKCQQTRLPNAGFIWAVSSDGKLLASPKTVTDIPKNLCSAHVADLNGDHIRPFTDLPTHQPFEGLFYRGKTLDIISVLPIKNTGFRLLVHQNTEAFRQQAIHMIFPFLIMGGIIAFITGCFIYVLSHRIIGKKYEHQLKDMVEDLRVQKGKSDKLLSNILPDSVTEILRKKGHTLPESYENVTVFYSDIIGFDQIASEADPKILIDELDDIFAAFDNIMERNQCERIRTIGDAYLAVCGMPGKNGCHAKNIVKSAIEILEYFNSRNLNGEMEWMLRIGIHSGRVVGGIVGMRKYVYDVFGDTIHTALQIRNTSLPMRINISESTHELVKDLFSFTSGESAQVSGKDRIKTFFISKEENGASIIDIFKAGRERKAQSRFHMIDRSGLSKKRNRFRIAIEPGYKFRNIYMG